MKSIRRLLPGMLLAGGALLGAAAGISVASVTNASAADDVAPPPPAPGMPGEHGPGGREFGPLRLFGKLGLTADQQASVKAIMTAAKPRMQILHAQMQANHLKLTQTKPDDPNYGNMVAEVAQSNAALASQRTTQTAEIRSQMYAVLTPAQRTQLAALEAQWASHPHPHPGRWGAPPPVPPTE